MGSFILLALAAAVYPQLLAVVVIILTRPNPRRLLWACYLSEHDWPSMADMAAEVGAVALQALRVRPTQACLILTAPWTVQATPDQTSHFPELTKSTETARKLAQELAQLGGKADSANDFAKQSAALKSAVEEAQGTNQDFHGEFYQVSESGLEGTGQEGGESRFGGRQTVERPGEAV